MEWLLNDKLHSNKEGIGRGLIWVTIPVWNRLTAAYEAGESTTRTWRSLPTPWRRILHEKLTVSQLIKKFSRILWNPKVNYCNKSSPHNPSISWARLTQSMPLHPISCRPISTSSFHLRYCVIVYF